VPSMQSRTLRHPRVSLVGGTLGNVLISSISEISGN
jgi:hypothetical protein